VLVASALPMAGHAAVGTPPALPTLLPDLGRSTFAERLGETFDLHHGATDVLAVQLTRVRDLRSRTRMGVQGQTSTYLEQCFSLVFRGPNNVPLGQGVYRFEHTLMGSFSVLITPLSPDQDGRYYESIFNSPQA
jgi:hypothetical protein